MRKGGSDVIWFWALQKWIAVVLRSSRRIRTCGLLSLTHKRASTNSANSMSCVWCWCLSLKRAVLANALTSCATCCLRGLLLRGKPECPCRACEGTGITGFDLGQYSGD